MTRDEARKLADLQPILKAFADGKKIEWKNFQEQWGPLPPAALFVGNPCDYRVAPEPKPRTKEDWPVFQAWKAGAKIECLQASGVWAYLEHPGFDCDESRYRVQPIEPEAPWYQHLLDAWRNGKTIQFCYGGGWIDLSHRRQPLFCDLPSHYRIKPDSATESTPGMRPKEEWPVYQAYMAGKPIQILSGGDWRDVTGCPAFALPEDYYRLKPDAEPPTAPKADHAGIAAYADRIETLERLLEEARTAKRRDRERHVAHICDQDRVIRERNATIAELELSVAELDDEGEDDEPSGWIGGIYKATSPIKEGEPCHWEGSHWHPGIDRDGVTFIAAADILAGDLVEFHHNPFLARPAGKPASSAAPGSGGNPDPVNHPAHYTGNRSGVEPITIAKHMGFCRGNVIKYTMRAGLKGGPSDEIIDLSKARYYLDAEIAMLKGKESAGS